MKVDGFLIQSIVFGLKKMHWFKYGTVSNSFREIWLISNNSKNISAFTGMQKHMYTETKLSFHGETHVSDKDDSRTLLA